jgi:hypothetical protein
MEIPLSPGLLQLFSKSGKKFATMCKLNLPNNSVFYHSFCSFKFYKDTANDVEDQISVQKNCLSPECYAYTFTFR